MLTVCGTNDIHSHVPQRTALFEALLRRREEGAIVVDAGDFAEGSSFFHWSRGAVEGQILRATYDAAAPGNHGFGILRKLAAQGFPVVNCNISTSGRLLFSPSHVVRRDGAAVAFVGVMSPEAFFSIVATERAGLEVEDPLTALPRAIQPLLGSVDRIVVLSHSGIAHDVQLAAALSQVDVFLSGHCHSSIDVAVAGRSLLAKGPDNGRGYIELKMETTGAVFGSVQRTEQAGECLFAHPSLVDLNRSIAGYRERAAEVALVLDDRCPLSSRAELLSFLSQRALGAFPVAAVALNESHLRSGLTPGPVTWESLASALPFDDDLVTIARTGSDRFLERLEAAVGPSRVDESRDSRPPLVLTTRYLATNVFGARATPLQPPLTLRDFALQALRSPTARVQPGGGCRP